MLTILGGEPGAGKSVLAADLAARITVGGKWPDGTFAPQGRVLYLMSPEDPAKIVLVPRLMVAGADRSLIEVPEVRFTLPSGEKKLLACIRHVKPAVVVIDHIASFLDPRTSANDPIAIRGVLDQIAVLADAHRVSVWIVMHLNKAKDQAAQHRFSGSMQFVAAARAAYLVVKDPTDPACSLVGTTTSNLAGELPVWRFEKRAFYLPAVEDEVVGIVWRGPATEYRQVEDVMMSSERTTTTTRPQPKADAALTFLRTFLADGRKSLDTVKKAAEDQHAWPTVEKAKQRLGLVAEKESGVLYWRLPVAKPDSPPDDDGHHHQKVSREGEDGGWNDPA